MQCLVLYDIVDDAARQRVADICLDFGLQRLQYSAFIGELSTTRQEELLLKARRRLGSSAGRVHIFPVCEKDLRLARELITG